MQFPNYASITPYGMGTPPQGQNYFGLGSNNNNQGNYGLQLPTMASAQFPQGIDYMSILGKQSQFGTVNLSDGSIFNAAAPGSKNWLGDIPGFEDVGNMDALKMGVGGLQTLGNLWGGMKSLGLANKQFDFTKMMAEKNLTNQTQSYNTALSDRINSRSNSEMSAQDKQDYLSKNSLAK